MRVVLAVLCLALPLQVWAQVPSAESLIRALRPADPDESQTRGVLRLPRDGGSPSTVVRPAAARPQVSLQVQFGFDSAVLTPQAMQVLDNLGTALVSQELAGHRFRLVGHTDARGSEAHNLSLSQRRAEAARNYLIERWLVDPGLLAAEGRGFRELADPARPLAPENRRVQVINEG